MIVPPEVPATTFSAPAIFVFSVLMAIFPVHDTRDSDPQKKILYKPVLLTPVRIAFSLPPKINEESLLPSILFLIPQNKETKRDLIVFHAPPIRETLFTPSMIFPIPPRIEDTVILSPALSLVANDPSTATLPSLVAVTVTTLSGSISSPSVAQKIIVCIR